MNIKKFVIASIVVFVACQIIEMIVHGFLLGSIYGTLKEVWRPDMMDKMWIMYITSFVFSFLFVYIYTKFYQGKGIIEGLFFGTIIGIFMNFCGIFNQYVIYPVPFSLAIQWFIYGMIEFIIIGAIASLIYTEKVNK